MVDMMDQGQGFGERSIVGNDVQIEISGSKERWVCANFEGHHDNQKRTFEQEGRCRECGQQTKKIKMMVPPFFRVPARRSSR